MQFIFHAQESSTLLLSQLEDRDTRRRGKNLGDEILINLGDNIEITSLPLALASGLFSEQVLLVVTKGSSLLEVLCIDSTFLLAANICNALVEFAQVRWCSHATNAQT